jgi:hypothetical protein
MRIWRVAIGVLGLGVSSLAQTLGPAAPRLQHATVTSSTASATVRAGERVALWVDVTPRPGVHIYASGARDFTPVALVMTPLGDVQAERAQVPAAEPYLTLGATAPVPVHRKSFRITQPVTIARTRAAGPLIVSAALNYQACDDTVCYPATTAPVVWRLTVR